MQKINSSFLAKTSISATGYKIKIGDKMESIINLFMLIFFIKLNNNKNTILLKYLKKYCISQFKIKKISS